MVLFLSGCSKVTEVDGKSFVTAIGFDKGENFNLRFTFVFTSPTESGAKSSGGEDDETIVIEAPSLYSAIEQINHFKSKTIELSHTQTVIFSEELAKEGIKEHIFSLVRSSHFRPNIYVCIADGTSMEFLEKINPVQTYHLEKYFQLFFDKTSSGKRGDLFLYDTYFRLLTEGGSAALPYCAINNAQLKTDTEKESPSENESEEPSEENTLVGEFAENTDDFAINTAAGKIIRKSKNPAEIQGVAVVKNGVFVCMLGKMESTALQLITGNMPNNYITVSNSLDTEEMITCYTTLTENNVKVECGKVPKISVSIKMEGDYSQMGSDSYYVKNPREFEKYFEGKMKETVEKFLNKIRELNCDICGFSEAAKRNFLTVSDWEEYNWDEKFKNAEFDVDITLTIRTYGELSEDAGVTR